MAAQPSSAHLEHCRQNEKEQILLQINHTHCVGPAYPAIQKHLCGHYLPLSSFAHSEPKRAVVISRTV